MQHILADTRSSHKTLPRSRNRLSIHISILKYSPSYTTNYPINISSHMIKVHCFFYQYKKIYNLLLYLKA